MMTRGTKRLAGSDSSAPDSNDSALQSKRVMAAPRFDVHRAEPSHQHLAAEPKLDVQRAQLCHLHVRALNTQYASWVQSQLQNHPDELWQDGTKDYITHASHIMEKFSDVVAWLRANASKTESMPIAAVSNNQKSSVSGVEGNKAEPHPGMNSGSSADGTVSHTGLWSSALSSDAHQPVLQGYQGAFAKTEASEDLDEENEVEKPSSPSLKRTEEKGIVIVYEVKCKLYVKPDNPAEKGWKDMGVGHLSIKCKEGAGRATKESKPTIVIRNDVGKILLNALIYPGIKMNIQKNTIASVFHTLGGQQKNGNEPGKDALAVARTCLLRMKTEEETAKLAAAINECTPSA
uniref:Nuclear pore complex protein Nup50 n=2 Tax=Anthurium amnicola TaxID=1678845 RepID=A0A1D1YMQ4_9ARAE